MRDKAAKVRNVVFLVVITFIASFIPGMLVLGAVIWLYSGLAGLLPDILPAADDLPYLVQAALGIWAGQLMAYLTLGVNPLDKLPAVHNRL